MASVQYAEYGPVDVVGDDGCDRRARVMPVVVALVLALLVSLQIWARGTDYALRVTSDAPTFLALIPDMADRPFESQSPFLADASVTTPHAEPYTQGLAALWEASGHSETRRDPAALARMLALVGIGVMLFVLFTVFFYARNTAGRGAGWVAILALLALFGPANVIWASDLSLHGFLYASWYPQNVAIALLLLTLMAVDWQSPAARPLSILLAAATMTVHPFTGVLLTLLLAVRAWQLAAGGGRAWHTASYAIAGGFALGSLWPAYSLNGAMAETGVPGWLLVSLAASSPLLAERVLTAPLAKRAIAACTRGASRVATTAWAYWLAAGGFAVVLVLALWEAMLAHTRPYDPLITTNRLATYWVEDRWRWPLMLAVGAVGVHGLVRLALRGRVAPGLWFAGCFAIGTLGAVGSVFGVEIPVWYRFLLAAQIPLAVGVAAAVLSCAEGRSRRARRTLRYVAVTIGFALVLKVLTLTALPPSLTYFRTPVQETYSLGKVIPPGNGLVATDPRTAYYIPGATGHRVLTVTKAHVGSPAELAASARGYAILHRFWDGGPGWWRAGQEMWRHGVRWIVIEKSTLLSAPTLEAFSTGLPPLVHPGPERAQLGNYYYEANRVGVLVADWPSYAVYRLDSSRLFPRHNQRAKTERT